MNLLGLSITAIALFTISFTDSNLDSVEVLDGKFSMLIPKDFIHIEKEDYIIPYEGAPTPDDYYCNSDTSIQISILEIPKRSNDLKWCKKLFQAGQLMVADKIYFNDTISINGSEIYLAKFEGMSEGKETYCNLFIMNLDTTTVLGVISCDIELKEKWIPISNRICESIKII